MYVFILTLVNNFHFLAGPDHLLKDAIDCGVISPRAYFFVCMTGYARQCRICESSLNVSDVLTVLYLCEAGIGVSSPRSASWTHDAQSSRKSGWMDLSYAPQSYNMDSTVEESHSSSHFKLSVFVLSFSLVFFNFFF